MPQVQAGGQIAVSWTGPGNQRAYIAVAVASAPADYPILAIAQLEDASEPAQPWPVAPVFAHVPALSPLWRTSR